MNEYSCEIGSMFIKILAGIGSVPVEDDLYALWMRGRRLHSFVF